MLSEPVLDRRPLVHLHNQGRTQKPVKLMLTALELRGVGGNSSSRAWGALPAHRW
jgi:hypothetical protein